MKRFLPTCALIGAFAAVCHASGAAAADAARDDWSGVAQFGDHEVLHGRLESFSSGDGLGWGHRDSAAPLLIRPETLDSVELREGPVMADPGADALVQLSGGDAVAGKVVTFTPEKLVLDTAYAGRLSVDAHLVRSLAFGKGGMSGLVEGFGKFADWKDVNMFGGARGGLKIEGGKMVLSGYKWVSRELPFPPSYRLAISAAVQRPYFQFSFSGEGDARGGGSGYSCTVVGLNQGQGQVHLMRQAKGAQEILGTFPCQGGKDGQVAVVIDADAQAKTLAVWVNGKRAGVARDAKGLLAGKRITLGSNGDQSTFSRLSLVAGGGAPDPAGEAGRPASDTLCFANQDQTRGRLLSIRDGKAQLSTEAGDFAVPLESLAKVSFSSAGVRTPAPAKGESQVLFDDFNGLHLRLDAVKDGKLTGHSQVLGDVVLDVSAVKRIVFNLDAPWRKAPHADGDGAGDDDDEGGAQGLQVLPAGRGNVIIHRGGVIINGGGVLQLR